MIDQKEALKMVLHSAPLAPIEEVSLAESYGRILRENWYADRDLPPYDRVTMDGIAINYNGAREVEKLRIEGIAAAGSPQKKLQDKTACLEVMTGAILPQDCDTVIRYEDLDIEDGYAKIKIDYKNHKNIHYKGEDRKEGDLLVTKFTKLGPPEIGLGASIGMVKVKVSKFPKLVIISTGDELVNIDRMPSAHQIRKSNVYRIAATLQKEGLEVDTLHIMDDLAETKRVISDCLQDYDAIILSGGVSKGKYDYVPQVLMDVGVEKLFHRVAQRPGKPFWFGRYGDKTIFAFPGNPVSSFMCTYVYFMPWLAKHLGEKLVPHHAILAEDYEFAPPLTYLLQVRVQNVRGKLYAYPLTGRGSGDFANLVNADGFLQLPDNRQYFKAGEVFRLYPYR